MARSTSGESVLERAVRILEVFDADADTTALSVTEIATRAALPLSTASRLVDELTNHGLLCRDNERRVRIGVRLWVLGRRASLTRTLHTAAMAPLERLHAAIGHHVQVGVLENDEVLFIERLSARAPKLNPICMAARVPLHASASGLVLLAHAPGPLQHRFVNGPLAGYTDQTITDPHRLRTALAQVRRAGFAVCPGFMYPTVTTVAVPITDASDNVIAALSALFPRNDDTASRRLPALQAAAASIRGALSRTPDLSYIQPAV
jgi:DNA-binding IclR family transcriptional regulator